LAVVFLTLDIYIIKTKREKMKNKPNTIKINITVDLDEVKKYVKEYADENGLESSGGYSPRDLDQAWDEMQGFLPDSIAPLTTVFGQIIQLLEEVHDETCVN
jgi:hypothetical protein